MKRLLFLAFAVWLLLGFAFGEDRWYPVAQFNGRIMGGELFLQSRCDPDTNLCGADQPLSQRAPSKFSGRVAYDGSWIACRTLVDYAGQQVPELKLSHCEAVPYVVHTFVSVAVWFDGLK